MEIRILGRTDDVIVLKTGEKVQPRQVEDALNMDTSIRTAVCVGNGFFELAVIIEPMNNDVDSEAVTGHVWQLVQRINPSVDHHARITSRSAIIIKPAEKQIPRSDKGSIMRQAVHEIFKEEIKSAYSTMELDTLEDGLSFDTSDTESAVKHLVTAVAKNRMTGETLGADDDLFERGMDSLQAVRLARLLDSGLRQSWKEGRSQKVQISAEFIYRNPTIKALTDETARLINPHVEIRIDGRDDRATRMRVLADEVTAGWSDQVAVRAIKHTILMTGSTGNLGAHALARLVRIDSIDKVICLVRSQQPAVDCADSANEHKALSNLLDRQRRALETAGVCLEPGEWTKVEMLDISPVVGESDMAKAQVSKLARRITHILHLAWPMDFQRKLESFKPHIRLLQRLVELAQNAFIAREKREPIRLLFSSSIAVVRHYGEVVPESAMPDPLVSVPMGYAEAKWVCETYLNHVAAHLPGVDPIVIRVGQLSGPESTSGVWKTEEHLPALIQASQRIGVFPKLDGVSEII